MTLAASVNQGRLLPKGAAYNRAFFMGVTGLSLTVTISKNGASFGALAGTVTEISVGWYKAALTSGDTDTEGDLAFHATDGGINVEDWADQVAAPVKMADGVAHGGTPGSSTATVAFSRMVGQSQSSNTSAFSLTGNGNGSAFQMTSSGSGPAFYAVNSGGVGGKFDSAAGDGLVCEGETIGLATIANGPYGVGFRASGLGSANSKGIVAESYGLGSAVQLHAWGGEDFPGISGSGLEINAHGTAANCPAVYLSTAGGDGLQILDVLNGHGIAVAGVGTGKHDVNLAGSGDIQGTITGTVPANVKKVNDVTITGTGASGSEWGP